MISSEELSAALLLSAWVAFTVGILTKAMYRWMRSRGIKHETAVYYNRKFIHVLAGGVSAVAVPLLFRTAYLPFMMAMLIAAYTFILHRRGRVMYWFQIEGSLNEVSFCVMWGLIIALGWIVSGNLWFGAVPVLFMSVGDAVTGIVRNLIDGRRTKSWWGNLIMAAFSMSIGAALGVAGILAGGTASIIEHFEFRPLDDNIIVPLVSFIILSVARIYAPWTLSL
ncbi:MAG: dolichol kinase [Candidatus Bathyarchaeota archaeon B63]|nr:MAG: dolichol kinase [Candidatus Bathyarchaeota archaeon B63]